MRRIRTLGLGAVVALALLALPAGASATGGIEADGEGSYVELKGESVAGSHQVYLHGQSWLKSCPMKFTSESPGPPSTVVATAMDWSKCSVLQPNGCRFEFHPGSEDSFDIGPPGCGPIKATAGICKVAIPAQTGLPATYTNVGAGSNARVMIDTTGGVFKYTHENCKLPDNVGEFNGEWELRGFDASGNLMGIRATDTFGGFFLAGEASEANQPRFEAEKYEFPVLGEQDSKDQLRFFSPQLETPVECGSVEFDQLLWGATPELALDAQYSNCAPQIGGTAKVTTTGCSHILRADNAGPPYVGGFDLDCGEGALELFLDPPIVGTCTIKIPSQSLASVAYENLGAGASRTVAADVDGQSIEYSMTEKGFGCLGTAGTHNDGVLEGGVTLGSL